MNKKGVSVGSLIFSIMFSFVLLLPGIAQEIPKGQDTISLEKDSGEAGEYDEEIHVEDLPESVRISIDEGYQGFEILRAYKNQDGNFRLELENGSDKAVVYYDMNGKFLKTENHNNESSLKDM
jgi:hypothetical protein